ncbi:VCBS repeat-containing protein [Terrimonas alba]|uniref:VCBS repeat-containing protein n=1 Tax=Terrimonas alba TaxID=3349636 RepID=UPI0035F2B7D1
MSPKFCFSVAFFCIFCLYSCTSETKQKKLFELKESTGIDFSNNVTDTKDFNVLTYRNFYNGGGVAIGDINNDGLADVFFTANMGANKLYKNRGNWQFEDISQKAGFVDKQDWSTGVVMVDINYDGWLDIYVCSAGYINGVAPQSKLYINNGVSSAGKEVSFTEAAEQYGLTNKGGYATHAAFFDYDLDGDLDAFIINNSFIPVNTLNYANKRDLKAAEWPVADFLKGGGDRLFRNDNGKFVDVSKEAGVHGSLISFGLGVTIGDVNKDSYPDVYVSNDFFERDYLYINQKNGTFKDELEDWMGHTSLASMGADIGDINNDGLVDIFTTDMLPDDDYRLKTTSSFDNIDVYRYKVDQGFYHQFMQNTLQVNNGNNKFLETGFFSGVAASDWSWGALMFDADNDGLTDIYVCNGIYHDVTDLDFIDFFANDVIQKMVLTGKKEQVDEIISKIPSVPVLNKAFKNEGNLKFSDAGTSWGFTKPSFSNGAAYGDLDNDGDLDLVINNVNEKAFVYQNNTRENSGNKFIGISLKGRDKNTFAIGSQIKVYLQDQVLYREIEPSRGFQSSVDYKQIIGLGNAATVDSVIVVWPDATYSKSVRPELNRVYELKQQDSEGRKQVSAESTAAPIFQLVETNLVKHQEDDYVDFYYERNLPEMLSRGGPQIAKADVNGDGMDDIYIGGAKGQPGQLYFQTAGGFRQQKQKVFDQYANFEDVAVLFFDCDDDNDMDLFIGSGGNNVPPKSKQLQHRLYRNNGKGGFEADTTAFPKNDMNISEVVANDFDNDGDLDLFVGSRNVAYRYGETPSSYLYLNDGKGYFTDVAKKMNEAISAAGMVTGAAWADVYGDEREELIVAGEWMSPRIFTYNGKTFDELKNTGLKGLYGCWQTLAVSDLNGDGKSDLILGNIGENFYLRPDSAHPVKMWMNDFDQNGVVDQVRTRTINGRDMPVLTKKDLTDQFPGLKKENLKNSEYARKSIQQIFNKNMIDESVVKMFNYSSSIVAINNGNGSFEIRKLPFMTQLSSINAIAVLDVNNDRHLDLVVGGNSFQYPPQFGRLDASCGDVLINNGKGNFERTKPAEAGLKISGEVRDIEEIHSNNQRFILFTRNNMHPVLYRLEKKF